MGPESQLLVYYVREDEETVAAFCLVVPEICRGQVHGARKERRITRIIIIIIRNGAKTISLQTLFGRLNKGHH
jgi:hypothetical protein